MVRIEYLQIHYGRQTAALSIDSLAVDQGERVAVIGPSGAGKSTLLRCIKGHIRPVQGKLEVMGVNLTSAPSAVRHGVNRKVGFIFQQFHLAPRLTVLQNVLCGRLGAASTWRSLLGKFTDEDRRIAWEAICEVGLQEQVHQRADTLSGGEMQRVAVARAVAQKPSLILGDEPVSSLDPAWAEDVLDLIATIQAHHQATLIMSLHQPHLALQFASRVIGLRGGRIVFDEKAKSLCNTQLEELYRGDEIIRFNPSAAATGAA